MQPLFYSLRNPRYTAQLKWRSSKSYSVVKGLAEANGVISSLSIIAILAGTFAFSISFEQLFVAGLTEEGDVMRAISPIGLLLLTSSLIELVAMYRLPHHPAFESPTRASRFDYSKFFKGKLFAADLAPFFSQRAIRLSVVGLATFWGIGQVMLAAYPAYFKSVTGENNTIIVQGILACSGLGIALGAFLAGRASRNKIELGYLPFSALIIAAYFIGTAVYHCRPCCRLCFFLNWSWRRFFYCAFKRPYSVSGETRSAG